MSDTSQGEGWWQASDGKWYPPEQAPAPPAAPQPPSPSPSDVAGTATSGQGSVYTIREEGRNGTIEVQPTLLIRTVKKRMGRDDHEMIPIRAINSAKHDRKRVGADVVTLLTASQTFEWKVANSDQAAKMVAEIIGFIGTV